MERPFALSGRNLEVLNSVIRCYLATGEPVPSRAIAAKRRDKLSPASIRNVMAQLEMHGYLMHPHTSAGRIPTERGIQQYVQSLNAPRLGPSDASFVRDNLDRATSLEERLDRSSHVLATLTRQLGIVVLAPLSEAVFEQIQFMQLSDQRILVVLVAKGEVVRHRIIRVAEPVTTGELERISNYLNQNFAGWKLSDARSEILRRIQEERAEFDAVLRRLRMLYLRGFLSDDADAQVYLEGAPNLVDGFESLDAGHVRQLLQALEDKQKLIDLLDRCLREDPAASSHPGDGGEVLFVRIGLADAHPAMKDYAVIGASCDVEPGVSGRLAVIGPTRMQYEKALSAVAHLARVFQSLADREADS